MGRTTKETPRKSKAVTKAVEKVQSLKLKVDPGSSSVIYLGHLPEGFAEQQMRKFFAQFGVIQKLKVAKNPKTGHSRGYAFIQFTSNDIAKVVAEAMNGYFIGGRRLVCHVLPESKIHDGLFKGPKNVAVTDKSDADDEELPVSLEAHRRSLRKKEEKLKKLGIEFDIAIPE